MKQNLLFFPGPRHLFWTCGVYYVWELARSYHITCLVEKVYKSDQLFQRTVQDLGIEVRYYSESVDLFWNHYYFTTEIARLVRALKPAILLQHNWVYFRNMYLVRFCRAANPACRAICYQNGGMMPLSLDDEVLNASNIVKLARDTGMSRRRAAHYYFSRARFTVALDYYLLPGMLTRRPLTPSLNPTTQKILRQDADRHFDLWLSYFERDEAVMRADWPSLPAARRIRHPLSVVGGEVHALIYPGLAEGPTVAALPSFGFLSELLESAAGDQQKRMTEIAGLWGRALAILAAKFPGCRVVWKGHPLADADPHHIAFQALVREAAPFVEFLDHKRSGESVMVESRVVVSDISSVLWWAQLVGGKTVISLDLFGYAGGALTSHYNGIRYFDRLEALEVATFDEAPGSPDQAGLLTLTECLAAAGRK